MQEREITSRIRLDELQGLLATTSLEGAPITARMPAVRLEELLQPEEPPPEVQVTFRRTPASDDFDFHDAEDRRKVLGTINGVPVHLRHQPDPIDAVIDAAVDAAIDAAIHNAEIDAAIDAVVLAAPPDLAKQRYGVVALSFALSFVAGIIIFLLA